MKSLLVDPAFKYWPVSSIFHYARRNNILHISLATWYSYMNKLGIHRSVLPRKAKQKIGIRAKDPHQIWYSDITIVKCLNGMKYYVYLLMDTYSRFILNYQVPQGCQPGFDWTAIGTHFGSISMTRKKILYFWWMEARKILTSWWISISIQKA